MHHIWHNAPYCHVVHLHRSQGSHLILSKNQAYFLGTASNTEKSLERAFPGGEKDFFIFQANKMHLFHFGLWEDCDEAKKLPKPSKVKNTLLTLWCLKNVFNDMHSSPMWSNIRSTFVAVPPASNIANDNNRLPAGIRVPSICCWLLHTFSLFRHLGFAQRIRTSAIVPIFFVSSNVSSFADRTKPKQQK